MTVHPARVTAVLAVRDAHQDVVDHLLRLDATQHRGDGGATGVDVELVVVDDASDDGTADLLAQVGGDVVVVRHAVPVGWERSLREAVWLARTDVVLLLGTGPGAHAGPADGWLDGLLRAAAAVGDDHGVVQHTPFGAVALAPPVRLTEQLLAAGPVLAHRDVALAILGAVPSPAPSRRGPADAAPAAEQAAAPLRVLLVPNAFPPSSRGGIETYVTLLATGLRAQGAHPVVLHPYRDRSRPDYELQEDVVDGTPVLRVNRPENLWHQEYGDQRFEAMFAALLEEHRIDVVHFHHLCDGLSPSLIEVARHAGRPTVLTLHDGYVSCAKGHAVDAGGLPCSGATSVAKCVACVGRGAERDTAVRLQLTQRADVRNRVMADALAQADLVTAPSRYIADLTRAAPWAGDLAVEVRPLGLDLTTLGARRAPRRRAPGAPLRVVVMGNVRVHPSGTDTKGGVLIAAAAQSLPGVRVDIFGDVDAVFAEVLATAPNITVRGRYRAEQRAEILADADVLLIASPVESFSFAAREALALGIPVVTSDGGALPEAVTDRVDGLTFEAGSARDLVRALAELDADEDLRLRLASAPVRLTGIDDDARAWLDTYRDLSSPPVPADAAQPQDGPGLAVVVIRALAASDEDLRRTLDGLHRQSAASADVEVAVVDAPAGGSPQAWAAALGATRSEVVVLVDAGQVPGPHFAAAHLAGHRSGACATGACAVVGRVALDATALNDAAARAVVRSTPGLLDGSGVSDGDVVDDPWSAVVGGSLHRGVLAAALDGAPSGAELAARLREAGVRVRFAARAVRHLPRVPDAVEHGAALAGSGAAAWRAAHQAGRAGLDAVMGLDDLGGRWAEVELNRASASNAIARFHGVPLAQLRATPVDVGAPVAVPVADLLDGALDLVFEGERLRGALGAQAAAGRRPLAVG